MDLSELVRVSREYGSDPRWVVAGGGNTSLKDDKIICIKASGFPLATIGDEGFARMDRSKLAAIWKTDYPMAADASGERERRVLADTMAARVPGEDRRPSVETLLHDLLPWPLVVHLHPTLVNGLTCGQDGPRRAAQLFGDDHEWIPYTDPGYVLAVKIKQALDLRSERGMAPPDYIFLENHGVFAGGQNAAEIGQKYQDLHQTLESQLSRRPQAAPQSGNLPKEMEVLCPEIKSVFGDSAQCTWLTGGELERHLGKSGSPLCGALTPDHIVYSGAGAPFLTAAGDWKAAAGDYEARWGKPPAVSMFPDGLLVTAPGEKELNNAVLLLHNALDVCAYAESFGGPRLMTAGSVQFITGWEVESYRSKVASGG